MKLNTTILKKARKLAEVPYRDQLSRHERRFLDAVLRKTGGKV